MNREAERAARLRKIERERFDLIVIGAGINGAGIARDGAMRGLRVLLVEQQDIAAGTTAFSTRLIHGGLRYLEYSEVGLVRESLRERERLLRIAPHLVAPLPFLIPLYAGSRRGPGLIRLGMLAYDLLSFDKSLPRHRMLSAAATLVREPGLNAAGLRGAALYYDGQVTFPERLTLENALAAEQHGATLLTYAEVDEFLQSGKRVSGVRFHDRISGGRHTAHGALVINVAGPWVDRLLEPLAEPPLIGGTKGTHIVVGAFPGAPSSALYVEATRDRRPYFIVPWNGQYLIGTTDIPFDGDPGQVEPDEAEIRYLLDETNRVIPGARLTRADVHYAYAGVRPLPRVAATNAAGITRRHIVHDHAPSIEGLISIVGGKLTTYRSLAAEVIDLSFRKLGRIAPRCTTGSVPLPGATGVAWPAFAATFRAACGLEPSLAERLLGIYGIAAWEIVRLARTESELGQPFDPVSGALAAEIVHAVRCEHAETLSDILLRRTMVGLGPDAGLSALDGAAHVALRHLGWDDARVRDEVATYRALRDRHAHTGSV
jgi:glycerol-3-phosphate dehydrogenase